MADPKTNRALGQTSSRGDIDADEDPLVELARIVSEDGGFSGPRPQKQPVVRNEPPVRDALADGLEAELLQELESSFAARETPPPKPRAPVTPAPPVNAAPAAAPRVAPAQTQARPAPVQQRPIPAPVQARAIEGNSDPDELLRSIEEQLSQFERRQAGRFSSPANDFTPEPLEPEGMSGADDIAERASELPFGAPESAVEPRDEWQGRRGSRIRPFAEIPETLDEIAESAPEPVAEEPLPQAGRAEYRFRGPASARWDRPSPAPEPEPPVAQFESRRQPESESFEAEEPESAPFSPAELAAVAQAPIRESAEGNGGRRPKIEPEESSGTRRRERLNATFPEFDEEPAVERTEPDLTGIEAELSRELEPRFATAASADKWQDGDAPANEPRVAATIAPGASRRAAAARAAAQQRGRSRLGLFAAAVILVVVVGGAAAFYLRGSESAPSGPPPVITADEGAVRVEPAKGQQAPQGETVGDAVYNRVAGNRPSTDEHVVDNSEEPKEVARIVLPQTQTNSSDAVVKPVGGDDASASADGTPPAGDESTEPAADETAAEPAPVAASNDAVGPRRVPTFVVKADGSIVATSEAGAPPPDPAAAQDQQLTGETEPIKPVPVPTVSIAQANAPSANGTASTTPQPPASNAQDADMGTRPAIDEPTPEVAAAEPAVPPAAPPAEANPPADQIAAAEPAAPAPPTATAGFSVQLSSEGSMADAQAAYARAQQKFPSVLGKLDPNIQQADLGAKGIFYRVRVGPWESRKDAVDLCEQLKAAGGTCFVAK